MTYFQSARKQTDGGSWRGWIVGDVMLDYMELGFRIGPTVTSTDELHSAAVALFRRAVAEGNMIILRHAEASDHVGSLLKPGELRAFSEEWFEIAWRQGDLYEAVSALECRAKAGTPITELGDDIDRVIASARETGELRVLLMWDVTASRLGTSERRRVAAGGLASSISSGDLIGALFDIELCVEAGTSPEELRPHALQILNLAAGREPVAIICALKSGHMEAAGIPSSEQVVFAHCAFQLAFGGNELPTAFEAVEQAVGAGGSLTGLRVAAGDVLKCALEMGDPSVLRYVLESAVTPSLLSPRRRQTAAYREYTLTAEQGDMDGAALALMHALTAGTPLDNLRESAIAVAAGRHRFGGAVLRYAADWRASHPGTQSVARQAHITPALGN